MSTSQRNKGACAERELFGLLSEQLGVAVVRNYAARWEGGCDSLSLEGWAVEVKRQEAINLTSWWNQATRQAERTQRVNGDLKLTHFSFGQRFKTDTPPILTLRGGYPFSRGI